MIENSSESKVNREKAFLTIVIALVFLALIIAISLILFRPKITHLKQPLDTDLNQALNLQKAIIAYMINNSEYGPYLVIPVGSSIPKQYSIKSIEINTKVLELQYIQDIITKLKLSPIIPKTY